MDFASTRDDPIAASAPIADDDARLVVRVRAGDMGAFDTLVQKYRARLYGMLYHLTADREDAADLAQETFVKAFRNIGDFRGGARFYTWLYRIGVNTALTHLKRNKWRRFFRPERLADDASEDEILSRLAPDADTAARRGLASELQEKLNEALQKLSNKHRTVVVLFEIEGLDHAQIARIVGCSEGTVRSRLHYAKQRLQALLKPYLS